ncbi:unnamed protein product [Bursaphelenchus okinawaensis]|uniref:Nuclear receptor domain-containing protein n=1 Tax=Bursaphelenchus okinawaensis TaxID=465554 RepID=A0A811L714_9BILA|nr:unnamed protein product [Bursaphelenchus okinawaensis]CAG9117524.1 unnamed protein product [Bursaphelenchus okinawaensis]
MSVAPPKPSTSTVITRRTPSVTRKRKSPMCCKVCNDEILNLNFGAQVCRACASFYKRTYLENKKYRCITGFHNCNIDHEGSKAGKCKACRYEKCQQTNIQIKENFKSPTRPQPVTKLNEGKLIGQMIKGHAKYLQTQFDKLKILHPDVIFSDDVFITPIKLEVLRLNCTTVKDMLEMFIDHFGPFNKLERNDQIKAVRKSFTEMRVLNECYLSAKYCPSIEDTRLVPAPGYFYDPGNIDPAWYLQGVMEGKDLLLYEKLMKPLNEKLQMVARKAKLADITQVDTVVIAMIILWKNIENNGLMTSELNDFKNKVMIEWTEDINRRYQGNSAEILQGKMLFYGEVDNIAIEMCHNLLQLKLLRKAIPKPSDCCIEKALLT